MPPRDYQPGELVPGTVYRIVRPIGAGGMGTVYDVEDTTIGKRYVLKTLHPRLGSREDLARRMQNEARTLARLHHPNIVEVITAGVTADNLRLPFFVMERLDGQSLRVVLEKRGRLELPHAYNLVIDLLDALDHAHDRGIVHRDVKPDNIFLHRSPSGSTVTKLLDFGIVSLLDDADDTSGRFLGTLRYAAPEQLRGEKPTPKTDVYSAALVFYEILAGRGPFDDEGDPHRVGQAHLHQRPPPLLHFAWVPTELNGLVMAALDKDPSVRPRDAFSFAASLRNIKRVYPSMPRTLYATSGGLTTETTITAVVDPSGTAAEESSELARATDLGPADDAQLTHSMHSMGSTATRVPHGGTDVLTSSSSLGLFTRPPPPSLFTGSSSRGGFPSEEVTGDEKEPLSFAPAGPDDLAAVRRRPTLSEEPQVRSVPVASAPSRSRSAVALAGLGIAGLGALGILFVRVPHRSFGSSPASAGAITLVHAASTPPAARPAAGAPTLMIVPSAIEASPAPPSTPASSAAPPPPPSKRHGAGAPPSTTPSASVGPTLAAGQRALEGGASSAPLSNARSPSRGNSSARSASSTSSRPGPGF